MLRRWKALFILGLTVAVSRAEEEHEELEGVEEDEHGGEDHEGDDAGEDENDVSITAEQMRQLHVKVDENADGKLSMSEILAFSDHTRKVMAEKDIHSIMEEMDSDKDGQASLQEILRDYEQIEGEDEEARADTAARKELESDKFKIADKDGDGFLNVNELPALFYPEIHAPILELTAKNSVKAKDTDGDGTLSLKEFWEWESEEADDSDPSVSESSLQEQDFFQKLDKNGDGKVDHQEFMPWESGKFHTQEAMKAFFELVDTDKDEHVTVDEIEAAQDQIPSTEAYFQFMEWVHHHEL